jgi:hypothetical protein
MTPIERVPQGVSSMPGFMLRFGQCVSANGLNRHGRGYVEMQLSLCGDMTYGLQLIGSAGANS